MTIAPTTFQFDFIIGGPSLKVPLQFFLLKEKWVRIFGFHTLLLLIPTLEKFNFLKPLKLPEFLVRNINFRILFSLFFHYPWFESTKFVGGKNSK